MIPSDPIEIALTMPAIFERLGVSYAIGSGIAGIFASWRFLPAIG